MSISNLSLSKQSTKPVSRQKQRPSTAVSLSHSKSDLLHKGHWIEILKFLDISRDLLTCRAVSRTWRRYANDTIKVLLKRKEQSLNLLKEFTGNLSKEQKEKLDVVLAKRGLMQQKLDLIPLRSLKFDCLYNIWMLKNPPTVIREALISILYLVDSEEELKKKEWFEWEDCQLRMRSKKYIHRLKRVKPSDLSEKQIRKFEITIARATITAAYLHRTESCVAGYLVEWGQLITEAARELQEYDPEFKGIVRTWEQLKADQESVAVIKKNLAKFIQL